MRRIVCCLLGSVLSLMIFMNGNYATTSVRIVSATWKHMSKPSVQNTRLKNFVEQQYRPRSSIGSGSTADAIRHELATQKPVRGKFHYEKGQQSITYLKKWLRENPSATHEDIQTATNMLCDLEDAFNTPTSPIEIPVKKRPSSKIDGPSVTSADPAFCTFL